MHAINWVLQLTEIVIYEFANTEPMKALPALVQKCLEQKWKVVIQCESEQIRDDLNSFLWLFEKNSFLPHGTEADGFSNKQPIFLTCINENPNSANAKIAFGKVDTGEIDSISEFDRYMVVVDSKDKETVKVAGEFFQKLSKSGYQAKYQKQNSNGGWSERAIG